MDQPQFWKRGHWKSLQRFEIWQDFRHVAAVISEKWTLHEINHSDKKKRLFLFVFWFFFRTYLYFYKLMLFIIIFIWHFPLSFFSFVFCCLVCFVFCSNYIWSISLRPLIIVHNLSILVCFFLCLSLSPFRFIGLLLSISAFFCLSWYSAVRSRPARPTSGHSWHSWVPN